MYIFSFTSHIFIYGKKLHDSNQVLGELFPFTCGVQVSFDRLLTANCSNRGDYISLG